MDEGVNEGVNERTGENGRAIVRTEHGWCIWQEVHAPEFRG
jgi:hypothetical protein